MISSILLDNLIPRVFASEPRTASEVWLRRVEFKRGETILIEARSGAGKTSLASFLMGLRNDFNGNILFDGRDSRSLNTNEWSEIRRLAFGYLPQNLDLFPELTSRDNILVKQQLTLPPAFVPEGYHPFPVDEGAKRLGIFPWLDRKGGQLSIGQMQRIALLRALSQPFDFLILDEPVSHLDDANNLAAAELVAKTAADFGATVIVLSVGNRLRLSYSRTLRL